MPPMRNVPMKPAQNSSGVVNSIVPRHSVAIQLKIFTPVGTAIRNEPSMKKIEHVASGIGVVNMWCAQTSEAEEARSPTVAAAIAL